MPNRRPLVLKRKAISPLTVRLAAYSATAGAALIAPTQGHATIVPIDTFSINFTNIGPVGVPPSMPVLGGMHSIGFKAEGLFNFKFMGKGYQTATVARSGAGIKIASTGGASFAVDFAPGDALTFANPANAAKLFNIGGGPFRPTTAHSAVTGYIGFKGQVGTAVYYGWLHIQALLHGGPVGGKVISIIDSPSTPGIYGAYDLSTSVVADNFKTGVVPEPTVASLAGLALLALGATGIRELRRRRQAVAS